VSVGELATRDFIRGELSRLVPEDAEDEGRKKGGGRKRRDAAADPVTG
jgi:hypothetical protein